MALADALRLHAAGRLAEAEQTYREALSAAPHDERVMHNLGMLRAQRGALDEGLALIERALAANAALPLAHFQRGSVLMGMGRIEEARDAFARAIALKPDFAEARFALGNALFRLGRLEEAASAYSATGELAPRNIQAMLALGIVLLKLGRNAEALAQCERALGLAPRLPTALHLKGQILIALGRPEEALAAFDEALALEPGMIEAVHGRIGAMVALMRWEEALAACDGVLARDPDSAFAHNNRGVALRKLGRNEEALAAFERALALDPASAESWFNRAGPLESLRRLDEAYECAKKALAFDPAFTQAADFAFNLSTQLCDWKGRAEALAALVAACRQGRKLEPFTLVNAVDDPELHQRAARAAAAAPRAPLFRVRPPRERLRIAYLSADFREHPVAHQAVSLFESHDRAVVETIGVCLYPAPDTPIRKRLRAAFEHFVEAHERSDTVLAQHIASLEADIVVDLGGYTDRARTQALAWRPAPLAVNWLGYPGTLGASYVDYIIADAVAIPPASERFIDEKVVRVPGSFMPVSTFGEVLPVPSRASEKLPETGFVFCNFNRPDKITPEVFDVWMRLLLALPGSVLWLAAMNGTAQRNLRTEAQARGVDPQRLVFAERRADRVEHLARLKLADLFLDTLPYNAHATAADFLCAGVPVLTCAGQSFASRVAASLLTAAGAPGLITHTLAEYEALALTLSRSRGAQLAARLPAAPPRALARALEAAYATMTGRQRRGLPPEGFTVPE